MITNRRRSVSQINNIDIKPSQSHSEPEDEDDSQRRWSSEPSSPNVNDINLQIKEDWNPSNVETVKKTNVRKKRAPNESNPKILASLEEDLKKRTAKRRAKMLKKRLIGGSLSNSLTSSSILLPTSNLTSSMIATDVRCVDPLNTGVDPRQFAYTGTNHPVSSGPSPSSTITSDPSYAVYPTISNMNAFQYQNMINNTGFPPRGMQGVNQLDGQWDYNGFQMYQYANAFDINSPRPDTSSYRPNPAPFGFPNYVYPPMHLPVHPPPSSMDPSLLQRPPSYQPHPSNDNEHLTGLIGDEFSQYRNGHHLSSTFSHDATLSSSYTFSRQITNQHSTSSVNSSNASLLTSNYTNQPTANTNDLNYNLDEMYLLQQLSKTHSLDSDPSRGSSATSSIASSYEAPSPLQSFSSLSSLSSSSPASSTSSYDIFNLGDTLIPTTLAGVYPKINNANDMLDRN